MGEQLRIIMVEDSATDAALLVRALKSAGFDPDWRRVDTEPDLLAALANVPDVVFSDFQMPQFNGLRALTLVKERLPDLPFIIVSGQIGEDTAVQAIKLGAADYLLKDRINRLGHAVRNALEQARLQREHKASDAARRESEERLQLFIEHAPAALAMFDREMRYLTLSQRWREDYGLATRPLVGVSHYDVFPEIDETWRGIHRRALAGETIRADEDRFVRADGRVQWLTWEVRPWYDGHGAIGGIVVFSEDITMRKTTEAALKRSEQSVRRLYTTMSQGVVSQDATGRVIAMNPAAERILGRTPADFVGESSITVENYTVREDGSPFPGLEHPSMEALRTGAEVRGVIMGVYNPKERQRRWISISAVPLFAPDDEKPEEVYAIFEDITERKRAEEELRQSEAILRETGRIAKIGGWSFDIETGQGRWTEEVARIHDLDPSRPVDRDIGLTFYRPESRAVLEPAIRAAVERGISYDLELEIVTARGVPKWIRTIGHPQWEGDRVVRLYGSFQDITERKRAEVISEIQRQVFEQIARGAPLAATLRRLLELIEAQAENCICAIMLVDADGKHLRTAASISLPAAYTQAVDGVEVGPAAGSCGTAAFRGAPVLVDDIASDPLWSIYGAIALPHGLRACWSFPILAEQHQVLGTFAVYGRVAGPIPEPIRRLVEANTQTAAIALIRWRDETARRESEARFRELADTINEVFWITDPAKRQMLYVSPAYERIWGRTCESLYAAPENWIEAVHEADRARVADAIAARQVSGSYTETFRIVRPTGEVRWILDRAFPVRDGEGNVVRLVGVAEDITEKKQIEAQFLRAQRLEAVGALAGGVAHDLNNILTPVLMAAGVLKGETGDERDLELLGMIEQSARRGADIIRQLLAFSRGVEGERIVLQPRHIIREMASIVQETFPREIELHVDVASDLWPVEANSTQLHQVLMNLCVNARDAMPQGGRLTLEARNREIGTAGTLGTELKPGRYVMIGVADTGQGMKPEVVARIFEPFFTTKEPGKGTGLGLSTVLGIVRSHGGQVTVYSEPGRGSQFRVYVPARPTTPAPESPAPQNTPAGRGELILVVDDEVWVREATRRTLEQGGYRVELAANGEEALKLALQKSGSVRLVLTDAMMPLMDGVTLARALQTLDPKLPVIATSGLIQEDKREELLTAGVREILAKPCAGPDLLAAVRRTLDAAA